MRLRREKTEREEIFRPLLPAAFCRMGKRREGKEKNVTQAEKTDRMKKITEALRAEYPDALCALHWENEPWKLLVMGMLSAQCTDARVNLVCETLFRDYPTPERLSRAPIGEIEDHIRSCGLYHTKAVKVKGACALLVEKYQGILPDTMEQLLEFPGVGRKVANLLLGDVYGKGGIVADTHCIRICGRFGMYPEALKDPVKVEKTMEKLVPREEQSEMCHRLVQYGRDVCTARNPKCGECKINTLCNHYQGKNNK